MEISLRYPPVRGRLHTRYAPVRRSPAVYCYTPLPLDLHVLSLPLAFILSQDQTLHCKNCLFFLTFDSSVSLGPALRSLGHTLSLDLRISTFSRFPGGLSFGCRSLSKAGAKIRPFFKPPNFFFAFFLPLQAYSVSVSVLHQKKNLFFFIPPLRKRPAKTKNNRFFSRISGFPRIMKTELYRILLCFCILNCFSKGIRKS